jgi:hypothetical protein
LDIYFEAGATLAGGTLRLQNGADFGATDSAGAFTINSGATLEIAGNQYQTLRCDAIGHIALNPNYSIAAFTNKGAMRFTGGDLAVTSGTYSGAGTLNFDLDEYTAGAPTAILTVAAGSGISGAQFALTGGNGMYKLIKTDNSSALGGIDNAKSSIDALSNALKTYTANIGTYGIVESNGGQSGAGTATRLDATPDAIGNTGYFADYERGVAVKQRIGMGDLSHEQRGYVAGRHQRCVVTEIIGGARARRQSDHRT